MGGGCQSAANACGSRVCCVSILSPTLLPIHMEAMVNETSRHSSDPLVRTSREFGKKRRKACGSSAGLAFERHICSQVKGCWVWVRLTQRFPPPLHQTFNVSLFSSTLSHQRPPAHHTTFSLTLCRSTCYAMGKQGHHSQTKKTKSSIATVCRRVLLLSSKVLGLSSSGDPSRTHKVEYPP